MTLRAAHPPHRGLWLFAVPFVLALTFVGCGDGETANTSSTPTRPWYLQTPQGERQLPEGAFAIGWDRVGELVVIGREPLPEGYEVETVVNGLRDPVGLAFFPDGRALVTEQHEGRIRVIEDGTLRAKPFAEIENVVRETLELGLLGIAVDPEFDENHWVYAFYVEADAAGEPKRSVLLRFTERDGIGAERQELAEFPAATSVQHNGGGLEFGPDGKLYLPIGDTQRQELAPDLSKPVGKILRLNRDGSAPEDNPFVGREDADPRVFASGFRNVFDVAFHPELPGRLIALENAVIEGDEINIVRPGADYGWPAGGGERPLWVYLNPVGPAGTEVYTGDRLKEFQGDLFFCQFHEGGALHRVRFSDDFGRVESDAIIATGCTASMAQGPDGFLYFVDWVRGGILRIVGP